LHRRAGLVLLALAIAMGLFVPGAAEARDSGASQTARADLSKLDVDYVPGEVLVEFRKNIDGSKLSNLYARHGGRAVRRMGLTSSSDVHLVRLGTSTNVTEALRRFSKSPLVVSAEPNYIWEIAQAPAPPNDPRFSELWGFNNVGQQHGVTDGGPNALTAGTFDADANVLEAWERQTGTSETVIAVLDTGVDVSHPDLAANLWVNEEEAIGEPGDDDDGNGCVDDIYGCNVLTGNGTTLLDPPNEIGYDHGTHVAGTAAAVRDNNLGVSGVCPGCRIMVVKVAEPIDDTYGLTTADTVAGFNYASRMGAQIINASFGGGEWSRSLRKAIHHAGREGALTVVAAGNENGDNDMLLNDPDESPGSFSPSFPAAHTLPTILSVGASTDGDEFGFHTQCAARKPRSQLWQCTFTNWGAQSVDVVAPGVDILSTLPGEDYAYFNGTSMATPFVAGIAGLVKSEHPSYSPKQIKNAILNTVDEPDALNTLFAFPDRVASGRFVKTDGRVDAAAALDGATTFPAAPVDSNVNRARRMPTSSISGFVKWPTDINDVYRRRLVDGRTYKVKLPVPAGKDYDLWVWKPGTKEIWQFELPCIGRFQTPSCRIAGASATPGSDDEVVCFTAGSTGRYYLHATAWLFERGSYTLRIRRVSKCPPRS
jgi:thermitase